MRWLVLAVAVFAAPALAGGKKPGGSITLNGEATSVRWSDGDSFHILSGPHKGRGTRLTGYNSLESYGPVHRWGEWTAKELYAIAKSSAQVAAAKEWTCTTDGKVDGYQRLLIDCPLLAVEMVRQGHGLAYAVEGAKAAPAVLEAQAEAQREGRGLWKKGVVKGVVTSVHSVGEDGDEADAVAYNRVVDTRTGEALKRRHEKRYATCEEVCETTDGDTSCMTFVPFKQRYKDKPDCLR